MSLFLLFPFSFKTISITNEYNYFHLPILTRSLMSDELLQKSALELAQLIRTKQISPLELTHLYLD
ncbi:MAG: amidase, partial [Microcystis sp. M49637_WE12]|nr:amidase [Microcystis sp. M49637_WE12]